MTKKLTGQSWLTHSAVAIITKYLKNFPYDVESIRRQFKLQNKDKSPSKRKRDLERGQAFKRKKVLQSKDDGVTIDKTVSVKKEETPLPKKEVKEVVVSDTTLVPGRTQVPPVPEDKVGFHGDTLQERISNHFRAVNSGQAADLVYLNSVKKLFSGVVKKKPIFDSISNYSKMSLSEIRREYSKFQSGGVIAPATSGGVVLPPPITPKTVNKSSEKSTAPEDYHAKVYEQACNQDDIDMSIYSEASVTMEYIDVIDLVRLRYLHTYELDLKKSRKYSTLKQKDQRLVNDHIYELAERLAAESNEYREYSRWQAGHDNKQMVRGEKPTQQWSRAKQKRIPY